MDLKETMKKLRCPLLLSFPSITFINITSSSFASICIIVSMVYFALSIPFLPIALLSIQPLPPPFMSFTMTYVAFIKIFPTSYVISFISFLLITSLFFILLFCNIPFFTIAFMVCIKRFLRSFASITFILVIALMYFSLFDNWQWFINRGHNDSPSYKFEFGMC